MPSHWALNASPIVALSRIRLIHLIPELCADWIVPEGVAAEIRQGPGADPANTWLDGPARDRIRSVGAIPPRILAWDLGRGETEVIAWESANTGAEAIVDDRAARNCAKSLGIRVRGTIGILLLAKKAGKIDRLTAVLDRLDEAGFRVAPALGIAARRLGGEAEELPRRDTIP